MATTRIPRGIRLCNPLNIRVNSDLFQGETRPSRDTEFKTFRTAAYGYRAAMRILQNYQRGRGLRTIRQLISRWAPSNENHTEAYIATVSQRTGIPADVDIALTDRATMIAVVSAMSYVENGREAVAADVQAGWELLGGLKASK